MEIGAQLYTVRHYTQTVADFSETIQRIANMGYKTVQLSAIGKDITPAIARAICDEYGIKIVLTHSDPSRILHDTERLIQEHELMGCRYIGLGSMPEKYREAWWISHFKQDFLMAAREMKAAGMRFMYHNHDFEFEKVNGRYLIDYLLTDFAPDELGITLDTFWVHTAGADVCEWIKRLSDRIPCVHLKDRAMVARQPVMAPVLEGNMNFTAIMEALQASCCEYALVEQDVCSGSPFECLNKSHQNIKALGYA